MFEVCRYGELFLIGNSNGGYGRFTLSADDDTLYVYDVEGRNILNDVYTFTCSLSRQMGLKQTKSFVANPDLVRWYQRRCKMDPLMSFDLETRIATRLNHG